MQSIRLITCKSKSSSFYYSLISSRRICGSMTLHNASSSSYVLREESRSGVVHLTLNKPKERNALSLSMIKELTHAVDTMNNNKNVKVLSFSVSRDHDVHAHMLLTPLLHVDAPLSIYPTLYIFASR